MAMDWARLLSTRRFAGARHGGGAAEGEDPRGPFLRDLDRILYSSAFRRLHDKTQVYPFPETDYVRTRLTHSLEVSSVGRSLGLAVGGEILRRGRLERERSVSDLAEVIAAACLAHDIGHPPFGHAGEEAIRHWFRHDRPDLLDGCSPDERADLENFESNAQGFRILTRLQFWRDRGGMRLCAATLGAFTKYPCASWGGGRRSGKAGARRKFGFVRADRAAFVAVAGELGLLEDAGETDAWAPHPLALLVEAADDICYLVVDLEDGVKSGRLTFAEVEELLCAIVRRRLGRSYRELVHPDDRVAYLRAKAMGVLIEHTAGHFLERERALLGGRQRRPLLDGIGEAAAVRDIRALCSERLYNDERKVKTEIAGFAVVRGLLDVYAGALLEWEKAGFRQARVPFLQQNLLAILPEHDRLPRRRYEWLLRVTDYVSGMTNRFAVAQHRAMRGTDLGPR